MPQTTDPAAIGISVSSTRLRAAAMSDQGVVTSRSERSRDPEIPTAEQINAFIDELVVREHSLSVCVAVPGLIETGTSRIVDSRIRELSGSDFRSELSRPNANVIIENDANAAAFAEFVLGAGKGSRNLFCVSLDEGVGSGLILNGEIWRGANGYAGEFGATVVDEEGTRLEDIASIPNIVRRTRSRFHQDKTSTLKRLREDDISFADILSAAEMGDDLALLMLERTGMFVGTALAAAINLLNPERIVIAGEVIRTPSAVLDAVIRRAKECSSPRAFAATEIELSQLDEFASAVGAALIARNSTS